MNRKTQAGGKLNRAAAIPALKAQFSAAPMPCPNRASPPLADWASTGSAASAAAKPAAAIRMSLRIDLLLQFLNYCHTVVIVTDYGMFRNDVIRIQSYTARRRAAPAWRSRPAGANRP